MTFDISAHLGAMSRTVEDLERDGQPAKAVVASRVYDTDMADLWDALTNPARLPRWFAQVDGDLVLGGRFHVQNNASGTVTACDAPRHLAGTWEFGGGVSWIEIDLTPEGSGTRLVLRHIAPLSPHWDQFGPGAVGVGWELGLLGLSAHLAAPDSDVRAEGTGWETSDEAKAIVRASSDGWGTADMAAGETEAQARKAAEATRRFYSGEPPQAS
jgi:uncharacterized protein YndB with AHSA1/START domain